MNYNIFDVNILYKMNTYDSHVQKKCTLKKSAIKLVGNHFYYNDVKWCGGIEITYHFMVEGYTKLSNTNPKDVQKNKA